MAKTNALRRIEQAGIPHREAVYPYDESDLSGLTAARAIGIPLEQVFKTLVTRNERGEIVVFCIPVCCELNLKKAAKAAGEKSIEMLPQKRLLPLTGYIHGGCSPVGMKKPFPTFFDLSAEGRKIFVSGGKVGVQIEISAEDLLRVTGGKFAALTR